MASTYTYGQGTQITVTNAGSDTIYLYNWDGETNEIIPILVDGEYENYETVGGGDSVDIVIASGSALSQTSLFFSQSRLLNSLEGSTPAQPDMGNPSADGNIPFTQFEYSYAQPAQYVRGGLSPDFTAVDGFSYPIQWGVDDTLGGVSYKWGLGGSAQYNGGNQLGALDLLRAWMVSTPFTDPYLEDNTNPLFSTGNLVWQDGSVLNNNRIVGPSKIWTYGGSLPSFLPTDYTTFTASFPYNGTQLAQVGAFGSYGDASTQNNDGWQFAPSIDNGYTYSMQQTASALGGITTSKVEFQGGTQILPAGFQGFYTYPTENPLGGITYLADQVALTVTVGSLSSSSTIGTSGQDKITGTIGSDVISGGFGGDRLTGNPDNQASLQTAQMRSHDGGSGASDVYLYLRADSSMRGKGLRDVITDFQKQDAIDVAAIDANTKKIGQQSFRWINEKSFKGKPGQLRIEFRSSGNAFLQGDNNGDARPDFEVKLLGLNSFSSENLVLS